MSAERAAGTRMTKQRAAIVGLLELTPRFSTAQQIHLALRDSGIGLATVYRALQALAEEGALDVLRTGSGEVAYRLCESTGHHHHLTCRGCGRTVEIAAAEVEAWAAQVAAAHGFTEIDHTVELAGLCSQCAVAGAGEG
ncbi:MAG: transcriptional repressor [Bifidobacteriaceae bacterium]|jgi:Fur family ferric uptake transcriptional regulator|nr:transcriptional repressor [Bifidobacteriaceae bacterium]